MLQCGTAFGKQIGVEQRMSYLGRQLSERSVPAATITVVQCVSQPWRAGSFDERLV